MKIENKFNKDEMYMCVSDTLKKYLYEPNTEITISNIVDDITPYFSSMMENKKIEDYRFFFPESENFKLDIWVKEPNVDFKGYEFSISN